MTNSSVTMVLFMMVYVVLYFGIMNVLAGMIVGCAANHCEKNKEHSFELEQRRAQLHLVKLEMIFRFYEKPGTGLCAVDDMQGALSDERKTLFLAKIPFVKILLTWMIATGTY